MTFQRAMSYDFHDSKHVVELLPNTTIDKEIFLYLNELDETQCDISLANEAHK